MKALLNKINAMTAAGKIGDKQPIRPKTEKTIEFERIAALYLDKILNSSPKGVGEEMEIRFGKNNWTDAQITKIDYDNVVKTLISHGFRTEELSYEGQNHLRINCEYVDPNTGHRKTSHVRADIIGTDLISAYCKTNSIQALLNMPSTSSAVKEKIKFTQKTPVLDAEGKPIAMVHFDDHNFRVDIKTERDYSAFSNVSRRIIDSWMDSKKSFRYLNRVRLMHSDLPVFADLSILQKSATYKNVPIMKYTIQEAGVFDTPASYEIELEVDSNHHTIQHIVIGMRNGTYTKEDALNKFMGYLRTSIRIIMSALQDTMYPIGNEEQQKIALEYMQLIHGKDYEPRKNNRVFAFDFVGPSPVTLQLENVSKPNEKSVVPNIRTNYCVTEKADGERKLLFINHKGHIYFIDNGMRISFTGCITGEKELFGTLLDGEHIKHNKHGKFINLYAAFDVYYIHEKCVRDLPFFVNAEGVVDAKQRMKLMNKCVEMLKIAPITGRNGCPIRVECKMFYISNSMTTIFQCSDEILARVRNGLFEYETDGLIYTPIHLGVGATREGMTLEELPKNKRTWEWTFKWKPPEFNTIDFLVTNKLDKSGNPEIHTTITNVIDENGEENKQMLTYRAFILNCGFNRKTDGYIQPWQDVLDDKLAADADQLDARGKEITYLPTQFVPSSPYDPMAGICYLPLTASSTQGGGIQDSLAESGEIVRENTIVEFKFDLNKEGAFRWIPLRVRHDKTAQLLNGAAEYGNAFRTANSNWRSIHNPITEDMICSGEGIPDIVEDEDVYYADSAADTMTQGLRDFHNRYVKRSLILAVSHRNQSLIDFAVGRGGDLSKWKEAGLGFVFGVDVAKANIENRKSGACARYLDMYRTSKGLFGAIFLRGNSSLNLRDGAAFATEKEKTVAKAVFGTGPKDRGVLGAGVFRHFGQGKEGFHVSSVQFALHYFFENDYTLHGFLRNVAECTRMGGYFIGTCYDGKIVFDMLSKKMNGEPLTIVKSGHKIYELTKKYNETAFPDDEQSLGYAIDMYQESINKTFQEYLVNFVFFTRMMENYGFALVKREEARNMGLPNGTGMFKELYVQMMDEIKRDPTVRDNYRFAHTITEEEKTISFMNRYFVFKKIAQIQNPEKIAKYLAVRQEEADMRADEGEEGEEEFIVRKTPLEQAGVEKKEEAVEEVKPFIRRIGIHKFFITAKTKTTGKVAAAAEEEKVAEPPKKMTIRIPKK